MFSPAPSNFDVAEYLRKADFKALWSRIRDDLKAGRLSSDQAHSVRSEVANRQKRRRKATWSDRAYAEAMASERVWFVTLTFNPKRLPATDELARKSGQLFYKRLRRRWPRLLNEKCDKRGLPRVEDDALLFRHMTVLEHGDENGRVHLHALIFCRENLHKSFIQACWSRGITEVKLVKNKRKASRYISKYLMKESCGRVMASQNPSIGFVDVAPEDRASSTFYERWVLQRIRATDRWPNRSPIFDPAFERERMRERRFQRSLDRGTERFWREYWEAARVPERARVSAVIAKQVQLELDVSVPNQRPMPRSKRYKAFGVRKRKRKGFNEARFTDQAAQLKALTAAGLARDPLDADIALKPDGLRNPWFEEAPF